MTTTPPAIIATSLSKLYPLYASPRDRLREALDPRRRKFHHDFYALRDISFEVRKGETIGIIGQNGCGKSTLLSIIAGVLYPSSGAVEVKGRVSSLLELGTGFNPELTGVQNIYFNGAIQGFSRHQIDAKLDEIIAFADIGEFINQPVKVYSSGMYVRLAFSMVVCIDPEILIIDEALSVGDLFFQAKSMARMTKLIQEKELTLLFVSHDIQAVNAICSRTMLLENGRMRDFGPSGAVTKSYVMQMLEKKQELIGSQYAAAEPVRNEETDWPADEEFIKKAAFDRYQNGKSEFYNFALLNDRMEKSAVLRYGERMTLKTGIRVKEDLPAISVGYSILNKNGVEVTGFNSFLENRFIENPRAGENYIVQFTLNIPLAAGSYNVMISHSVPLHRERIEIDVCDRIPCICQFEVLPKEGAPVVGSVFMENELKIRRL